MTKIEQAIEALEDFTKSVCYDSQDDEIGRWVCCGVASYRPHLSGCVGKNALAPLRSIPGPATDAEMIVAIASQYDSPPMQPSASAQEQRAFRAAERRIFGEGK